VVDQVGRARSRHFRQGGLKECAEVPFVVLAAALVPAVIVMVIIAAQAAVYPPIAERARREAEEIARRR